MFFIGIFGVNNKTEEKKTFSNALCPDCGRWTQAKLLYAYSYFHFFFLPLFRFHKKYYVEMRCGCGTYEADEATYRELLERDFIDFSRLRKCGEEKCGQEPRCPSCGRPVDAHFTFCPYCGQKMR